MNRRVSRNEDRDEGDAWDDESADGDDGGDAYDDDAYGDDSEELTGPCPWCKAQIHEDAEQCPSCGKYLSAEDAPPQPKPLWIVIGVGLCLYAVYRWIVF